jgi:hypothetical protein
MYVAGVENIQILLGRSFDGVEKCAIDARETEFTFASLRV